jgi:hypothetical protein
MLNYSPGHVAVQNGQTDAQQVQDEMGKVVFHPVVVENKPGQE